MKDLLQTLTDFLLSQGLLWIFYILIFALASYSIYQIVKAVFHHFEKHDSDLTYEGLSFETETKKKRETEG